MRIMFVLLVALAAPAASQAQEPAANKVFIVDSDNSRIHVLAYPDGPLKRFGHHHVISHTRVSGSVEVAPNPLDSVINLELAVTDFDVDDPESRALEGEDFEGEVPEKDIEGTRANMLGDRLLNGEQFPAIQIRSSAIEGSMPDVNIVATVSVIGVEQTVTFPASIELSDDSFAARGELEITHGELGLAPFTAMGGALSVRDLLVLKYEISGAASSSTD